MKVCDFLNSVSIERCSGVLGECSMNGGEGGYEDHEVERKN